MRELFLISLLFLQAPAARPGVSISGRISFSDGLPAQGVVVRAVPVPDGSQAVAPGRPFIAATDAAGMYRITVVPGRYYVRAEEGAPFVYYPGVALESDAMPVASGDSAAENINISLPPSASGFHVAGRVKFPAGQRGPAPNQTVQLNGGGRQVTWPIAADGSFDIPHVRRGNYQIMLTAAPGVAPSLVGVTGADVRGLEFDVPRQVPVSATVTMENGAVRPRLTVGIEGLAYRTNVPVGSDGTFRTDVPEGRYRMAVSLAGGYYVKSIEAGKTDLQKDLLEISEKDAAIAVKIAMGTSPGVRVTGHVAVTGGNNAASSMQTLTLQGRAINETVETPIASDGSFELAKAVPGVYNARVTLASKLSSPVVDVTIPNRDLRELVVEIPPEVEVRGRVEVDGYGPPPRFSLLLVSGDAKLTAGKAGDLPSVPAAATFEAALGGKGSPDIVGMNVNALPDGSFKMKLPEGTYRVAAGNGPNGVPSPYVLRAMNYGSADLLKEPMKLSSEASAELQVGFGTTTPDVWASVGGKVRGFDPANGPLSVALDSRITSAIETPVGPDGSFEFPRVLKATRYTARIVPADDAASSPAVIVADKDVTGVEIVVPRQREIRVVASMEDNTPAPVFVMALATSGSTVSVAAKPGRDGSFTAKFPMDERQLRISGFPLGYTLKSATYRGSDILKQPLKISRDDTDDLQVAFAPDPSLPFGSLTGQITGLDPAASGVRMGLHGITSFAAFETSVGADGSFSFSNIPQGAYIPILIDGGTAASLTPSTVVVSGSNPFSVQLTASSQPGFSVNPVNDDEQNGVTVSNLLRSRQAAQESSGVAQLRTINTAEVAYMAANGGSFGTIPQLVQAGLLDQRFNQPVSGYNFSVIAVGGIYVAATVPESPSMGRYGYFSTPGAIINFSTVNVLAPPAQAGKPVQ